MLPALTPAGSTVLADPMCTQAISQPLHILAGSDNITSQLQHAACCMHLRTQAGKFWLTPCVALAPSSSRRPWWPRRARRACPGGAGPSRGGRTLMPRPGRRRSSRPEPQGAPGEAGCTAAMCTRAPCHWLRGGSRGGKSQQPVNIFCCAASIFEGHLTVLHSIRAPPR